MPVRRGHRRRVRRVEAAGRGDEADSAALRRLREVIAVRVDPAVGRRAGGRARVRCSRPCRSRAGRRSG